MNAPSGSQASGLSRLRAPLGNALLMRAFRVALVAGLGLAGLYLCYRLTVPFFTPLAAAFILAVLSVPFHRWVSRHVQTPSAAAFISVLGVAGFVLTVLVLLAAQLFREAAAGAVVVRRAFEGGVVEQLLADHPRIARLFQSLFDQLNAASLAADAASWLTNMSASMLRGSIVQVAGVLLTFYLLFYFLRDRAKVLAAIQSFLPFTESETAVLFASAVDTVHATVYGIVITGALLGLLGGAIFAAVGLPAPVLWGSVMAVFAILPILGIGMIWMPAAAWLALNGAWPQAAVLTIAFTSLSVADSMLYPYLVGDRMRLHTAIAFIAAIGGLIVFGAVGFVVGPLVVSLVMALKDVLYARANGREAPAPTNSATP